MTTVRVRLGAFAAEALTRKLGNGGEPSSADFAGVIQFYLREKPSGATGWAYPEFMRDRTPNEKIERELRVEDTLWDALEEEARAQDVPVERLLEHATLFYAAAVDAGRVTKRILEDFEAEAPDGS